MPDQQADVARITYRYLRWLMIGLPGYLLLVTVLTAARQHEFESSISAYYGTPVRDVFVGVMIATAVCMIAYKGASLLEDYTLNVAGFYAAFVALVPTNLDETLSLLRANPTVDGVTPADYIWFLRIALTAVLGLSAFLLWIELKQSNRLNKLWTSGPGTKLFVIVTSLFLLSFSVLAMWKLWEPETDDVTMTGLPLHLRIHDLAAILLITSLAVAVWSHAWPRDVAGVAVHPTDLAVAPLYRGIFAVMLFGPAAAVVVHRFAPDHTVIFLEWWEILVFCAFWSLETKRIARVQEAEQKKTTTPIWWGRRCVT